LNNTKPLFRVVAALLLLGASLPSFASTVTIVDLLTETSGPFQHNAFHRANRHHGMGGPVLAWFNLGASDAGFWNTDTGDFELSVQLYRNRGLSRPAGTASATGNLSVGAFNGHDGGLLGTLTWDFSNATNRYLKNLGSATISFIDIDYTTSTAGYNANSIAGNALTLWGAEGRYNADSGRFGTHSTTIGMDMVGLFDRDITTVPLPASVWLFGFGLVGLSMLARRRAATPTPGTVGS